MKHKLSLFAVLLMVLTLPNVAKAYDFSYTYQGKTLFYSITDTWQHRVQVDNPTNGNYYSYITGDVVIPDSVENNGIKYAVTCIGNYAFEACSGLTSVIIPNSITWIDGRAFYGCSCLTTVTIPNSVTSIGNNAFYNCSGLTSVTISNSVSSIEYNTFYGCSGLTSVTIPNSVTSIGEGAFYNCSGLTSVTIPNSVTSISGYAFYNCSGLTSVTIPNSVTSIGERAFQNCSGLTSVIIPNLVTSIGGYAFYNCRGLTSVTIPNSVISIGERAFQGCSSLTSITIPTSVTSIGNNAFSGMRHIVYYGTATGAPWGAYLMNGVIDGDFVYSNNTRDTLIAYIGNDSIVNIPGTVNAIGPRAFKNCSGLTSITISNSVTSIGEDAFYGCNGLTAVNYTGTIAQWCGIDFSNYNSCPTKFSHSLSINGTLLNNLFIPDGVAEIKKNVFFSCSSFTSVTIPNSVTSIGSDAFYNCSGLTSVTIPSSVTLVGSCAFENCSGLTSVTIPNSVASIGNNAFTGCSNLVTVYLKSKIAPTIGSYCFSSNGSVRMFIIPCGSYNSYYEGSGWLGYRSDLQEETIFSFNTQSADNMTGIVYVITEPTCQSPTAVFMATANNGYHFSHWSDNNTDNPRMLALIQDTSITAYFDPNAKSYNVVANNAIGGGVYESGSTAIIFALPQVGLQFDGWSDGETANPRYIVVMSDTTLTAVYSAPDTIRVYDTTTIYDTVINIVYDTTEYNHYYYDTTRIYDTLVVFDTTWTIDTLVVYDTTRVFDTMVFVNIDTVNHYYFDTTRVFDTLVSLDTIHHYYFDTTRVFDTMVFVNIDTVNHFYFDTTRIFDTIVFVNVDTVNHYYFDTTRIFDTLVSLDTIHHYYFDTTSVFDTMVFVNIDTVNHYYFDTTRTVDTLVFYDTTSVTHYVFDSTWVFDSVWIFDSVYIFDTIYIHDTIVVGVDDVETINAKIYIQNGQIVVEGAEGNQVWLYDAVGRMIATRKEDSAPIHFNVPASGTYLVRVGNHPARRVVVIR